MPPRRRFDKKGAVTYSVVHRAHDDSLYYDNDASRHVLVPSSDAKNVQKKLYSVAELEEKLGKESTEKIRANEGLAAQYGVFFDDSKYDYMQHLKPMGEAPDAVFVGPEEVAKKPSGNIEDLFRDQLPSEESRRVDNVLENIPKELQGFNPDLDPRLREVIEALEDEAYIEPEALDKEEKDVFAELLASGEVEDDDEFYYGSAAEDDEWDMDNYEDIYAKYDAPDGQDVQDMPYNEGEAPEEALAPGEVPMTNSSWQKDFHKFKVETKNQANEWDSDDDFDDDDDDHYDEEDRDVLPDLPNYNDAKPNKKISKTKQRKKKGAMTDTTSFSMTSSALFRTEGLTLLDDRFEQLSKKYEQDEEPEYENFKMENERSDFDSMLDDFLDNYDLEKGGRRLVKKDAELKRLQEAADSVSKGKAANRRKQNLLVDKLGRAFNLMKLSNQQS